MGSGSGSIVARALASSGWIQEYVDPESNMASLFSSPLDPLSLISLVP